MLLPAAGLVAGTFWFFVSLQSTADKVQKLDEAKLDSRLTKLETSMIEIETQFCGNDVVRNLMHANDLRIQAMLWNKTFPGSQLPISNAYYPTIGKCHNLTPTP